MKCAKEPWRTDAENGFPCDVHSAYGTMMLRTTPLGDTGESIARRIVACVNACAGVTTENLERNKIGELIIKAERERDTAMDERIAAGKRIEELEQQRDELRAALESAVEAIRLFRNERQLEQLISLRATAGYVAMDAAMDRGNAAIAKVTQS